MEEISRASRWPFPTCFPIRKASGELKVRWDPVWYCGSDGRATNSMEIRKYHLWAKNSMEVSLMDLQTNGLAWVGARDTSVSKNLWYLAKQLRFWQICGVLLKFHRYWQICDVWFNRYGFWSNSTNFKWVIFVESGVMSNTKQGKSVSNYFPKVKTIRLLLCSVEPFSMSNMIFCDMWRHGVHIVENN